jgi:GNAT superfamily N-acetyltransferase
VRVVPVGPDSWADVEAVFGVRGDQARCWCQFFRMQQAEWRASTSAGNRGALRRQVLSGHPPALLATVGEVPAGWLALGPRTAYPRIMGNTRLARTVAGEDLDDRRVWAVTCFVVRTGFRRKGVASALLQAAPDFARAQGASAIEGHPVDLARRSGTPAAAELYQGVASSFAAAGYAEIARTGPTRPVMRLQL